MLHRLYKRSAGLAGAAILLSLLAGCRDQPTAAVVARGVALQQKGELNSARIELKNAVEADPADGPARLALATVYVDTGEAQSAEKEVRRAISLGQPAADTFPLLGKALVLQGNFQQALDETAQAAANGAPELLCVRADAYLAMGKRADARALFASVLQAHPGYPAALIGLGRVAFLDNSIDSAFGYADQALRAAPRNTDAMMFRGDLLRARQQPADALAMYDKALAVNPLHRTAHVEKAYLEIATGRFPEAQADLKAAAANSPNSLLVTYTQALLDFSQGKHSDAKSGMQLVLRSAPEHMPSVLLAGAVDFSLGLMPTAEQHLRVYLKAHPGNLYARKMLATAMLRNGQSPGALAVLAPVLEAGRLDAQLLALAGESYMQARNFNKAEEYFGKATELEPKAAELRAQLGLSKLAQGHAAQAVSELYLATRLDGKSQYAGMALVRTELGLQHFDKAYAAVQAMEQAQPASAAVQDLKGLVHLGKQDIHSARASFEKALQLQPSYYPAVANLAQLDAVENKPEAAKRHLEGFLAANRNSVEAMNALALLASSQGNKADTTAWLEKAQQAAPTAVAPAVRLITHYLLTDEKKKALSLARRVQVERPDDPDLLDLLGKSQLASGDVAGALDTYKTLAAALPRSPHVHMQVAALHVMLNNTAAAEDKLKTALAMQPDFPAAQVAQAELYVRKGQPELAILMARQLQRQHPQAAAGFQLEGDVLTEQKRMAQALPAYEQAYAFSKNSELVVKTANALRENGRQKEGEARLAQWLREHPKDVRVLLFRAETLLADQQYARAAQELQAVLALDPANVAALNNQAWAYQRAGDKRALATAEQAHKLGGDKPVVMDTLGWILVDQGDQAGAARGLALLQKASALAPKARDIRYHVAAGLHKTGNKAAARKELEQLLAGDTRFAQADDARTLLRQLD